MILHADEQQRQGSWFQPFTKEYALHAPAIPETRMSVRILNQRGAVWKFRIPNSEFLIHCVSFIPRRACAHSFRTTARSAGRGEAAA